MFIGTDPFTMIGVGAMLLLGAYGLGWAVLGVFWAARGSFDHVVEKITHTIGAEVRSGISTDDGT